MHRRPFITRAAVVSAAAIILVLPMLAPPAAAGTIWSEGPAEFAAGTKDNLNVGPGGLSLGAVIGTVMNQWTRLAFGDPARRYGAVTAYDSLHDEVVLFGGEGMPGALGDTWTYNISVNNWTNRNPPTAPSARYGHSMVYDSARGEVILFGGFNDSYLGDTWTYNLTTNRWSNRNPPEAPSPRYEHAMAYDSASGRVVLFGGYDGVVIQNDTWTYDPITNRWTNSNPSTAPFVRYFHAMAYDSASDKVVIFGGYHGILPAMGDTWAYDRGANRWTDMTPLTAPPARYSQTMVYDRMRGELVMFGGYLGTWPLLGDTWTYNYGTNSWTARNPVKTPSTRYEQTMAYDSSRGLVVMFGGLNFTFLGDTWTYDPGSNSWSDRKPATAPSARYDHAMVYDSAHDKVVMFGGFDGYGFLNDTWTCDPRTGIWTGMNPSTAPPARRDHAMVYDTAQGKAVLFGGYNGSSLGDTWTYDLGANMWTNMSPPSAPKPRNQHSMVYDIARGEVLMVGGRGEYYDNGTWTYNLTTNNWTDKNPSTAPPARYDHAMAYDPVHGVTVHFGGGMDFGHDTCIYDPDTNNWTNMHPDRAPPGRYGHAMVYDLAGGGILLFGGFGYGRILGDTWSYDIDTNNWTNRDPPAAPSDRYSHSMVFASGGGGVVLFGGTGYNYLSDSWVYDNVILSPSGTYTSSPRDAGGASYFGTMSWEADMPPGTTIRFQYRSADTVQNLATAELVGPDGTAGTYYTLSGQRIHPAHNGSRWFQYRAYFNTGDIKITPILSRMTVACNLIHSVELLSPRGGDSWSGIRTVSWNASDPDKDALLFDLYLVNTSAGTTLLAANLTDRSWQWNSSSAADGAYQVRIVARDDHPSIPLSVNSTSGVFTVVHAAPNDPPTASLVSPADLATVISRDVTLVWKGHDPENDPMWYNLTWACGTFNRPDRPFIMTQNLSFKLANLTNATSYFWAVTPSDGNAAGPQTPVWRFNVNISGGAPANHPPRITSTPPTFAFTGVGYVYNVVAEDPDGDTLAFSLEGSPAGMTIDRSSGKISWTPPAAGSFNVTVVAGDGRGGSDRQSFSLQVLAPGTRPVCIITYPTDGLTVSGTINISGIAMRSASPLERVEVRIDGGSWQAVAGLESWRVILNTLDLANGKHTIEARACAGLDYSDNARARITVNNASPTIKPDDRAVTIDRMPCVVLLLLFMVGVIIMALYASRRNRQYRDRNRPPGRVTE